jgi:choline dehydrogenase-like flavoprotein
VSAPAFDYIIIGAGTAGCLLANRLSADASKRVLLIEAGRKDDYHWIHLPVGYLHCIGNPRTDWLYNTEPDAGLNGRALRYPRGKTLGGCSSINGMIYMRGQARDYDQWAQLRGTRWPGTTRCRTSSSTRHYTGRDALHGHAASGALKSSACAGTCSMRFRRPPASRHRPPTSTAATTKVGYFDVSKRLALEHRQAFYGPPERAQA